VIKSCMVNIPDNYARVMERLEKAACSVGRNPSDVKLIVVTKTQPVEAVKAAIEAGAKFFGENYPEEGASKINSLAQYSDIEWHMIGHVQSRKAHLVCAHFDMLHSLDSLKLANKLNSLFAETGKKFPVLLEVNVSGEESKFGWQASDENTWENLIPEFESVQELPNLEICGLMSMPPLGEEAEMSRPYFQKIRRLQDYLGKKMPTVTWKELSIGTSFDFEVAIQEGATMVRVGQSILGKRYYQFEEK